MDEKLKSENMQKRAVFYVYVIFWEQSGQAGVENSALLTRVRQHSALSALSWRFHLRAAANTQQLCADRTFAAAGLRLWNSLPVQLRNPDITYALFRRQLKRHLFREAWTRRSVTSDMQRRRKTPNYLLTYHVFRWGYGSLVKNDTC